MKRIAILICIRSLYPAFLFKRGSIVHIIFVVCLLTLMVTSAFGCISLVMMPLEHFAVPYARMLSWAIGTFWIWLLIVGIRYGVTHG
jgi:hypothetical protein